MTGPQVTLATAAALALSCGAAWAQAPSCGGLGASGVWAGGEAASSDIATSATALTRMGEAVATNGRAVTLFTLSAPQVVRVEARATRPGGDPVLELYDAAGALVITDDDSGGGRDSRAETELGAGAYCLLVRGFGDAAVTADIGAGRLEHEALTEGLRGGFPDPGGADGGPPLSASSPACPRPRPAH
jgi:hypothetical protein